MGKIICFALLKTNEYEECVLCGNITNINRNTPIELRAGYVSGVGQLCASCWREMYNALCDNQHFTIDY